MNNIELNFDIILKQCLINSYNVHDNKQKKLKKLFNNEHYKIIIEVFNMCKYKDYFNKNISLDLEKFNGNNTLECIKPSYNTFLNSILKSFSIFNTDLKKTDEELEEEFNKKINKLNTTILDHKSISKSNESYWDFIIILDTDYNEYKKDLENVLKLDRENQQRYKDYFMKCQMDIDLEKYILKQHNLYKTLFNKRKIYQDKINNYYYIEKNKELIKDIDIDKLNLYVIYELLTQSISKNDKVLLEKSIEYTEKYLNRFNNTSIYIVGNIDKEKIKDLLKTAKKVLKYGKDTNIEIGDSILKSSKGIYHNNFNRSFYMEYEEYEKIINKLKILGKDKMQYWKEKDPEFIINKGGKNIDGYFAIVKGGYVFLIRRYINNKPSTAIGNAIYYMKVRDYLDIMRENNHHLDKLKLINDHRVERIWHKEGWKDKVDSLIDEDYVLDEELEEALFKLGK